MLRNMILSDKCSIFSFDAIAMYTTISTKYCLNRLSEFVLRPATKERFPHHPSETLIEALTMVMCNNIMKFEDIYIQQLTGIVIGMSPAPTIVNLYVAILEVEVTLPMFKEYLPLYMRFIDNGLAVWKHCSNKKC